MSHSPPETNPRKRSRCSSSLDKQSSDDDKVVQPSLYDDDSTPQTTTTKLIDNQYAGYRLSQSNENNSIDTVTTDPNMKMTSETFFQHYIANRKPCILPSSSLPPSLFLLRTTLTRSLLQDLAGDQVIQVERRPHAMARFGQNRSAQRQIRVTIQELLHQLCEKHNELLYWSTQEDTDDPYNVPCRQLRQAGHLSHQPLEGMLSGGLILSSCNLWMGRSHSSSRHHNNNDGTFSSGLHHDFHDNFYYLLHGRKHFRLWDPSCAPQLSTYGTIQTIHPNGRISYASQPTRPDGVPYDELNVHSDHSPHDENDDDESENEEDEIVLGKGFDYVSDTEEEGGGGGGGGHQWKQDIDDNDKDDFETLVGNDTSACEPAKSNHYHHHHDDAPPDNFSRIPTHANATVLQRDFPQYSNCPSVTVNLHAGQMLYLPAGWFHEVTSFSNTACTNDKSTTQNQTKHSTGTTTTTTTTGLEDCHVALNYWFHPPDHFTDFRNPYVHDFWKREQDQRLAMEQLAAGKKA